jgi:glycosyltransferase involved in cell wall biosynthesis
MRLIANSVTTRERGFACAQPRTTKDADVSGTALREQYSQICHQSLNDGDLSVTPPQLKVGLLTGGQDRHYAFGLAMALISENVFLDVIGSDSVDGPEMHGSHQLRFLNLHGSQQNASVAIRIRRILVCYAKLIRYAATAKPKIFHILWNNKVHLFDRTLLMLYYKLLGKKIVFTAHNVNAGRRDSKDTLLNRLTLKFQYDLADHIFVHTKKMKDELLDRFQVDETAVTIIPYGINNAVPDTDLTSAEAKQRLGIRDGEKTILFFGAIKPYKGLEYLVAAFQKVVRVQGKCRLIIAGERKKGYEEYLNKVQQMIARDCSCDQVIQKIEFIPDEETELYFKAADVAVLPYTEIFQSGILFLAYGFGLPVIATAVGSLGEDIIEGKTGFVCKPRDADDLAIAIQRYFDSALFRELELRRQEIRDYALLRHSWQAVGELTRNVYLGLLGR